MTGSRCGRPADWRSHECERGTHECVRHVLETYLDGNCVFRAS